MAKAKRAKFGECFVTEGDRVCLVITDTVMQELDHLKFSTPKLARRISKLQSGTVTSSVWGNNQNAEFLNHRRFE